MAKKTFMYKGKSIEELKAMSIQDIAKILPSRQRRKLTRGLSDNEKKLIEKMKKKDNVKTQLRDMIVMPTMVGRMIRIHTGKEYQQVMIQEEMIGCYIGELAMTRKKVNHNAPGVGATKSSANLSVR